MSIHSAAQDFDLTPFIDHALLDPAATPDQVAQVCAEADRYRFASVCVYPVHVRQAAELLHQRSPKVCTVIGFPTGATTSAVKCYEAQEAVEHGAEELDVVINLGWLKVGNTEAVHREIASIVELTGKPIKAILEMGRLTPPEQRLAAELCLDAGVAFLKTHTGWAGTVSVADIEFLRELTRGKIGIKAAGGIRSLDQAVALVEAGATRLGMSRAVELLRSQQEKA